MPNDGMIDLGRKPAKEMSEKAAIAPKEVFYPSIHLHDVDGLEDLPEGEFTFTGKGKLVSYTERVTDGKKSCSCEIEIHGISPNVKKAKKTKEADERLNDSFNKIAKKKTESYDDED